jgi:hypothetical protein
MTFRLEAALSIGRLPNGGGHTAESLTGTRMRHLGRRLGQARRARMPLRRRVSEGWEAGFTFSSMLSTLSIPQATLQAWPQRTS